MRTKDETLLQQVKDYIQDYCDDRGCGPTLYEVMEKTGLPKVTAHRYLTELENKGLIAKGERGYESIEFSNTKGHTVSVTILGAVPCGPLTEVEEYIDGYVRLPESLIGKGKFFLLRANGTSMIKAGIDDGDMVLIRQQQTADVGQIIVALVNNEVTLKRLARDSEGTYYLHPENPRMNDIYVEDLSVQGVVVKILKDPK